MAGKVTLRDQLMFPSDYVSAVELKGRDVVVTIATVSMENMKLRGGVAKRKPVLTFNGTKKKFCLNVTNADSIASMYGTKAENWIGKRITLYPTTTKMGRDTVDCIRIRESKAKAATEAPFDEPVDLPAEEEEFKGDAFTEQPQELPAGPVPQQQAQTSPVEPPGTAIPPKANYKHFPTFQGAMASYAQRDGISPSVCERVIGMARIMNPSRLPALVAAAEAKKLNWENGDVQP